jgi:predicted dehydrogenase
MTATKNIAIIGCGYIANQYTAAILNNYACLKLLGICDKDATRLKTHADYFKVATYPALEDILQDKRVDIVVNLTTPEDHFETTKQCLEAGKHVYSEKPLAMNLEEAQELMHIASAHNVQLSGAPCTILSETAQTLWQGIKQGQAGDIKLVYAEIDDGPLHVLTPMIHNKMGIPWPHKNEFHTGCTFEHAAYYLSWFAAFFGPAIRITPFSTVLLPVKDIAGEKITIITPDFSCAVIEFASGVVARLTNSILAPQNHKLLLIGDKGVLSTDECWDYYAPCYTQRYIDKDAPVLLKAFSKRLPLLSFFLGLSRKKMRLVRSRSLKARLLSNPLRKFHHDFARGVAELALSLIHERGNYFTPEYLLHVNEMVFAIQNAMHAQGVYTMKTTFKPFDPKYFIWE